MRAIWSELEHSQQRYETCGDWLMDDHNPTTMLITVSKMSNPDYMFLIQLHETIEAYLCWKRGITQDRVDAFDMAYERTRDPKDESEPGDSPEAPYRDEHIFATLIERMMASELGVDWVQYEKAINNLFAAGVK